MELQAIVNIPDRMFFKIGEVAKIVGVKPYVLRYWESEFAILAPSRGGALKASTSQQRMYSRADVENILLIKHLLYTERFSIEGARKRIAELRKSGDLRDARKPKVSLDVDRLSALDQAKVELRGLLDLVRKADA